MGLDDDPFTARVHYYMHWRWVSMTTFQVRMMYVPSSSSPTAGQWYYYYSFHLPITILLWSLYLLYPLRPPSFLLTSKEDGRELVVSEPTSCKIRAEDGRFISSVVYSSFYHTCSTTTTAPIELTHPEKFIPSGQYIMFHRQSTIRKVLIIHH